MMEVHEVHSGVRMWVHPKRIVSVIENKFTVHKGTDKEETTTGTIIFVDGLPNDKPMVVKETYDQVLDMMKIELNGVK